MSHRFTLGLALALSLGLGTPAGAQHEGHGQPAAPGDQAHDHAAMGHDASGMDEPAATFLMQQSSGTSTQPSAWPMPMRMWQRGDWHLGLMAQGFLVYTGQSGPRGRDDAFSVNWVMGSASRRVGPGRVQLRGMLSLEPATVPDRAYPLLFQTGETAYGKPIVDGQHPHDFVMELGAQYVLPVGRAGLLDFYYAPVGDPAIGPVAFPHRASAMELPQATLGHHWQDSTHIASNVATIGWARGPVRLEASAFHGTEPDEERWNLDVHGMNSWSTRLTIAPSPRWTGQVSFGRLRNPEELHVGDVDRATASLHHVVPRAGGTAIASSLIWATNDKRSEGRRTHAVTVESVVPVTRRDLVSARFEWSQRDELFEFDHDLAEQIEKQTGRWAFDVSALTVGYTREIAATRGLGFGIGGSVTRFWTGDVLAQYWGGAPWSASVFLRVRVLGEAGQ